MGSGYVSGNESTGGEPGVASDSFIVIGVPGVGNELTIVGLAADVTVTVPVSVTFDVRLGNSLAALCSARSLSKVLLRPATVRRNETVCALHVRERVHGLPVSSFHTPQCRSASYSRSLSKPRSALSLFRLG